MSEVKSKGYEWLIVILMSFVIGMAGLDRNTILYLFPVIAPELGLNNTMLGALTAILALGSAAGAWYFGGLSDKVGRKKVLIPMVILFSVASWLSGVAAGFLVLLLVRGFMGLTEGSCNSTAIATIAEESTPSRLGLNMGLMQCLFPMLGWGFGAIASTQLAVSVGWRWSFFIVGVPGIVLAVVLWLIMREPPCFIQRKEIMEKGGEEAKNRLGQLFKYRNIPVCMILFGLFFSWIFLIGAFSPMYLTKVLGFDLKTTGFILSSQGWGALIGLAVMPALGDYFGRKRVLIIALFFTGLGTLAFATAGPKPILLFSCLLAANIIGGAWAPTVNAATPSESVPIHLTGLALGVVFAAGEVLGGALIPFIAGFLADIYGLSLVMCLAGFMPLFGILVTLFMKETNPKFIKSEYCVIAETSPNNIL